MARNKKTARAPLRLSESWTFETDAEGNRTLKVYVIENGDAPSVVGELTLSLANLEIAKSLANGLCAAMLEEEYGVTKSDLRQRVIELLNKPPATVLKMVRKPSKASAGAANEAR